MSDKTINYIGMGLGILVTIVIVCLSGPESSVLSMGDRHTYYDFLREFGGIYFAREYTDMFRVLLFGIGFFLSFKFKEKIGKTVVGCIGNLHKKV
ncbi:MAG: hypothetical protein P8L84_07465 [Methylococcaceae bacterium]|nr:hypothetical protein [Methylococcaceae bacterium]